MSDDVEQLTPETENPAPAETEAPADGAAPEAEADAATEPEKDGEPPKSARDYNRAFAALSRREKAFREKAQATERERASFAAERRELETYRALRQRARENPKAWLEAGALDRETAQKAWEDAREAKPESAAERRLAELEKQLAERDRKFQESQEQAARTRYVDKISRVIESDPAAYELLHAEGRADDVFELMDRHYREHNEVLPVEKACEALESVLAEQLEAQAKRLRGYKKLAPRLGWTAPEKDQPGESAPASPRPSTTTLSQRSAPATSPTRRPEPPRDPDEEWAEKVRRFERG